LFSVIIPTFNRAHSIGRCLDSVRRQTFADFEIIVVDNGSTDSTREIIESILQSDTRIIYIYQENSGSPAGSRNTGIKAARRDWVSFLDSDDLWLPNKLERVRQEISEHVDAGLVGVSHWENRIIDGMHAGVLRHGSAKSKGLYRELLLSGNCFSTSAMTVRRDILSQVNGFDLRRDYFAVEDYDLWMKISRLGEIASINEVLGEFHIGADNMSSRVESFHNNLKTLVYDHLRVLDVGEVEREKLIRVHGARIDYYLGRTYQLAGQFELARKILAKSILIHPLDYRKWASLFFSLLQIRT